MVRFVGETTKPAPTCDICGCQAPPVQPTPQAPQEVQTAEYEEPKAVCPNCEAALEYLDMEAVITQSGRFDEFGIHDTDDNIIMMVFKCPECGTVICDNEDDAKDRIEN